MMDYVRPTGQGAIELPEFISRVHNYCLKNIDKPVSVNDMA